MERYNCFSSYAKNDPAMMKYHDKEWGVPSHDEQFLIEMFILELFQAGLSWKAVFHKRENFRKACDGFDIEKIAAYSSEKIEDLMQDPGIIRNRRKIESMVSNARIVLDLQKEYGSFSSYLWHFTDGQTIYELMEVTTDELSDIVSRDLKKRGMKFVGSITIFSFLQSVGIIYSHPKECWRFDADHAEAFVNNRYVDGNVVCIMGAL
ncbi:MAG: DNA-3-methyladenine glycosylase I [Eggerthellaceae bacterium]|jgi:DNA-3-methyladenine glycosylase I